MAHTKSPRARTLREGRRLSCPLDDIWGFSRPRWQPADDGCGLLVKTPRDPYGLFKTSHSIDSLARRRQVSPPGNKYLHVNRHPMRARPMHQGLVSALAHTRFYAHACAPICTNWPSIQSLPRPSRRTAALAPKCRAHCAPLRRRSARSRRCAASSRNCARWRCKTGSGACQAGSPPSDGG